MTDGGEGVARYNTARLPQRDKVGSLRLLVVRVVVLLSWQVSSKSSFCI
jgi:hypothetical protein